VALKSRKIKKNELPNEKVIYDWKSFRKYWRIFFKDFDVKLTSSIGRKSLLAKVRKYKLRETDKKLRIKLQRLRNSLKEGSNSQEPSQKLKNYILKRTKVMKSEAKNESN